MIGLIAVIFIGWYFYRSATNVGKNGFLWVGIAFITFIATTFTVSFLINYSVKFLMETNTQENNTSGFFGGFIIGVISLFIVNHFLNQIYD
jgi:magnesium-transporting ATPase (P-type)